MAVILMNIGSSIIKDGDKIPGGGDLGIFGLGMCHPGLQIGTPF